MSMYGIKQQTLINVSLCVWLFRFLANQTPSDKHAAIWPIVIHHLYWN